MHAPLPATNGMINYGTLAAEAGFLLRLAQLKMYEVFFAAFEGDGIRPGAFSALIVIGENPGIRQGVLARALMIKPAHMTKMIRLFEREELVRRVVPDGDRRAVELALTKKGIAHVAQHIHRFRAHALEQTAHLSEEERRMLLVLLRKLVGLEEETAR